MSDDLTLAEETEDARFALQVARLHCEQAHAAVIDANNAYAAAFVDLQAAAERVSAAARKALDAHLAGQP